MTSWDNRGECCAVLLALDMTSASTTTICAGRMRLKLELDRNAAQLAIVAITGAARGQMRVDDSVKRDLGDTATCCRNNIQHLCGNQKKELALGKVRQVHHHSQCARRRKSVELLDQATAVTLFGTTIVSAARRAR